MIDPIPDDRVPALLLLLAAGALWVLAVPLAARRLFGRPPLVWSLPACVAAAAGLVYTDPRWLPFGAAWFALPVLVTAALALLGHLRRSST